jgi:hypothetical protein
MAATGSFRPRDYGVLGMKSAQAMNRYLRKFEDLQLLSKTTEGKASIYKTCGDVNLIYRESKRL